LGETAIDTRAAREAFDRLLGELRPKLHRYCARMTGSVIDGEDVVQEALLKAIEAFPQMDTIAHLEAWLFRITHNAALDFLRRRARLDATHSDADPDMIVDPVAAADERQFAAASLRTFMRISPAQRSSVILMDVLGYSLDEIAAMLDNSVPAIKAALHRGRTNLRAIAGEPDEVAPPILAEPERSLLAAYVDRFNARDFDAVREMLAAEVRLDLANRTVEGGTAAGRYFSNYERLMNWHFMAGFVERRPAILVRPPDDPSAAPAYFILLTWSSGRVVAIRDFYFAKYAAEDAEMHILH
jgi:RNA polymerase sigma-70 factor (ECF subfamily)